MGRAAGRIINMKETLIEKAKKVVLNRPVPRGMTEEEFDLALAYLDGEVSNKQLTIAAGIGLQSCFAFVAKCLVWGYRNKKLIKK